jgi:hypothetical protein
VFHGICQDKSYDISIRLLQNSLNSFLWAGGGGDSYRMLQYKSTDISKEHTISFVRIEENAKQAEIKLNQTSVVLCWAKGH